MKRNKSNNKISLDGAGFTLLEIAVGVSLFTLIIILVNTIFIVAQTSYNKNSNLAELSQNARVSLDRLSRELRQADEIVTDLPPTGDDPLNPPAGQIFFQDGHNTNQITYLRYYLEDGDLMRENKAYYFAIDPDNYVAFNSLDRGGEPPLELIIEDRIVGEFFTGLEFFGSNGLIHIKFNLAKNQNSLNVESSIYDRNR